MSGEYSIPGKILQLKFWLFDPCFLRACGALVIVWKIFARLQARKNLPHDHEKGSRASQAR